MKNVSGSRRYCRMIAMVAVVCFLTKSNLFADYGYFVIAEEPCSPRISAMGGAGTALPGGAFACYNPAAPAFATAPYLSLEYGKLPGDMGKSLIETAWMFPKWFAGGSLRVHSTDWTMTNEQYDPDVHPGATASDQSLQVTVTGGFTIGRFASGHALNFFQERIGNYALHALTYSPGVMYQVMPGRLTVGASAQHYFRIDTSESPWYRTPKAWYSYARGLLPRYVRSGAAWTDTLSKTATPYTVAADIVYADAYDRVMVPFGVEVWLLPYLAARAGMRFNHPTDLAHFGVGLRFSNLNIDLDYGLQRLTSSSTTESKWLLGFSYALGRSAAAAPVGPGAVTAPAGASQPALPAPARPALPVVAPEKSVAADTVKPAPVADSSQKAKTPASDSIAGVGKKQPSVDSANVKSAPVPATTRATDSATVQPSPMPQPANAAAKDSANVKAAPAIPSVKPPPAPGSQKATVPPQPRPKKPVMDQDSLIVE
jgi:hypothetical protein